MTKRRNETTDVVPDASNGGGLKGVEEAAEVPRVEGASLRLVFESPQVQGGWEVARSG